MDCYYHHAVPSVALCVDCKQPICPTCRSERGDCPGCRLAARIDAAAGTHELPGQVPPRPERQAAPPPEPEPQPQPAYDYEYSPPQRRRSAAIAARPESRALVALGYPLWPLALLALFDSSPFVKRQAIQALFFNFGMYGISAGLWFIAGIPLLGMSAWPLIPFVVPVTVVASVIYGFKVWQGEDVHVPIIGDFVEDKFHLA